MKKIDYWFWGIFILALFLRLYRLGYHSLWVDEGYALWLAKQRLSYIISQTASTDIHPPLFYSFFWAWINLLQLLKLPQTETWLRLPFAIFSAIQVPVLYKLTETIWNKKLAILVALGLAVSSSHIIMGGGEIKMYSMLSLFALLSIFFLYRWMISNNVIFLGGYLIFTILALYTHNLAVLLLLIEEIYLILFLNKITIRNWVIIQVLLFIGYLPWLPNFLSQLKNSPIPINNTGNLSNFFDTYLILFHGYPIHLKQWSFFYIILLVLIFLALILSLKKESPYFPERLFALTTILPVGVMVIISYIHPYTVFCPRHLIFILPFFLILIFKQYPSSLTKCVVVIFIICNLISLVDWYYYPNYQKARWKEIGQLLKQRVSVQDAIILQDGYQIYAFKYYFENNLPIYLFNKDTSQEAMSFVLHHYKRIWYLDYYGWLTDPNKKIGKWLLQHYIPVDMKKFECSLTPGEYTVLINFQKP